MKTLGNTIANSLSSITLSNGVSFVTITAPPTGIYIISLPPNIGTPGQFLQTDGAGSTSWQTVPSGTVSSVALTVPPFLTVTGSPITNVGTLNVTLTEDSPLPVSSGGTGITTVGLPGSLLITGPLLEYEWEPPGLAGQVLTLEVVGPLLLPSWQYPTTGTVTTVSASVPTFLSATVTNPTTTPSIVITYNTGTALPFANGGTGLTTLGLAGQVLTSTGAAMNWSTPLITAVSTDFSIPSGVLNLSAVFKATITAIEDDLAALTTEVGLISADVALINETLYTPITGLDFVVPANTAAILALGADITTLGNKTISLSPPSFLSVTGSPITLNTGGTFTLGYSGSALPVANGGTGTTSSTGTGSVVLSTSPTLVSPALGFATAQSLSSTGNITTSGASMTVTGFTAIVNPRRTANPSYGLRIAGNEWGFATSAGFYSSNAIIGDSVLRATGQLHLQSGSGNSAISISASNIVTIRQPLTLTSALTTANGGTGLTTVGTNGQVLTSNGTSLSWATPTVGTVTSVAASVPPFLTIAGSPIISKSSRNGLTRGSDWHTGYYLFRLSSPNSKWWNRINVCINRNRWGSIIYIPNTYHPNSWSS